MTATKTASVCALAIATVLVFHSPSAAQTAPTLSAQVVGNLVTFQWSAVPGALGYTAFVGSAPGGSDIGVQDLPAITAIAVPVPSGTYYVRLRAFAGSQVSDFSNEVVVNVGSSAPVQTKPSLAQTVVGNTVTLQWSPIPGVGGYTLFVGTAPGNPNLGIMNFPASQTSFQVSAPNGVYYARVRGFLGGTVGELSDEVVMSVPGPCATPGTPAITATVDGGNVTLTWAPVSGATGFAVQWSRFPGATELVEQTASTSHSKYVGMVGTFYARVVALSPCGNATSNEASFTIAAIPKRHLGPGEINSILEQVRAAFPRAWSNAHRSGNPERWDFIILATRQLFQVSGGTIGANWRRAAIGDLSMDGLSVENPADGRYYFADVICGAGGPSPSLCYTPPFHDGALLRQYSGGPYAPQGFANPMTLKTHVNYGQPGGW